MNSRCLRKSEHAESSVSFRTQKEDAVGETNVKIRIITKHANNQLEILIRRSYIY